MTAQLFVVPVTYSSVCDSANLALYSGKKSVFKMYPGYNVIINTILVFVWLRNSSSTQTEQASSKSETGGHFFCTTLYSGFTDSPFDPQGSRRRSGGAPSAPRRRWRCPSWSCWGHRCCWRTWWGSGSALSWGRGLGSWCARTLLQDDSHCLDLFACSEPTKVDN